MKRLALLAVLAFEAACDSGSYYLYTGNLYDPGRDCVSDPAALDVEIGSDPGTSCAPACLVLPNEELDAGPDAAPLVYATTECGPVPQGADSTGTNAECAPALAALARGDFCLDGGTSANPLDAGSD